MSMEDYESAAALIEAHPESALFVGARDASVVDAAEEALGNLFPPTYRRFLLEYGTGGFGSFELYGVRQDDFERPGNAVWITLSKRREAMLPENFIVVSELGEGSVDCLDLRKGDEAPVVVFEPGLPLEEQEIEVVFEDFGSFLLEGIRDVLGRLRK